MGMSAEAAWRSPDLGTMQAVETRGGTVNVFERGEGRPIVFAHGWLANANLWRKVTAELAGRFRTIAIDLPLGSHLKGMKADADLTPQGVGALIEDVLNALDLKGVVLAGNDSGGVYAQIAAARDPRRITAIALNGTETPGEGWPPPAFANLVAAAKQPGALRFGLGVLRDPDTHMTPAGFGRLAKYPIAVEATLSYLRPAQEDDGVLADVEQAIRTVDAGQITWAADILRARFDGPVAMLWSGEDQFFGVELARAYAASLKDGRVTVLPDSFSLAPEDQPKAYAEGLAALAASLG